MLLNKIKETTDVIIDFEASKQKSKIKQEYEEVEKYIKDNLLKVRNYKDSVKYLNIYNSQVFQKADLSKNINLLEKLEEDILQDLPVNKGILKFIFEDAAGKSKKIREDWKDYVVQNTQQLKVTLNCFRGLFEDKREINSINGEIDFIATKWPITNKDLEHYKNLLKRSHDIIDNLEATEEVQDFLRSVILGTATISDLTSEVLEWLKKKSFTNILSIQFKTK